MKQKILAFLLFIVVLLVFRCKDNKLKVDVSDIDVDISIHRYEKAIFNIKLNDIIRELTNLREEFSFFIGDDIYNRVRVQDLIAFITDAEIKNIYNDCMAKYPELTEIEKELKSAFQHYLYYFPEKKIPKIYSYVSNINYNEKIIYADSVVAIALDMYLGSEYYKKFALPLYQSYPLNKEYIAIDCMKEIAFNEFPNKQMGHNLLSLMIYNGKILYFIDAMFPFSHDTLKIAYRTSQLRWCEKNELNIWTFFIEKKLLWTTKQDDIIKYINDGPFTTTFPRESPARTGIWIGWQIVRNYMKNNPNVTLQQLMAEQDTQKILTKAKYKPKNK